MNYIKGFDGLRAVSIFFVILTHLGIYNHFDRGSFFEQNFALFSGDTGVKIFFSISGFLITSILIHEKNIHGKINFKKFFIRRFLRLMPPLLVFYIVIFIFMLTGVISVNYYALIISAVYCYNFAPKQHYTGELGHTWSLGVEEQFYLVWPFIINYINKRILLFFLAILIIVISLFFRIYFNNDENFNIFKNYFVNRWFIPACLPIIIGSGFAFIKLFYDSKIKFYLENKLMILLVAIFVFCLQIFVTEINTIIAEFLRALSVSAILLWITYNQNALFVKFLEFKPLKFLGKISYGLYVYQGLFLRTSPVLEGPFFQKFPINIALTFIFSLFSYYIIEKKFIEMKKFY